VRRPDWQGAPSHPPGVPWHLPPGGLRFAAAPITRSRTAWSPLSPTASS